jgi:hypothetical protein
MTNELTLESIDLALKQIKAASKDRCIALKPIQVILTSEVREHLFNCGYDTEEKMVAYVNALTGKYLINND